MNEGLIPSVAGKRAVLVASTGGHLSQLVRLAPHLNLADDPLWVTFESPQSQSLLEGQRKEFVSYIAPRDFAGVGKALPRISRILKDDRPDVVISTGAAVALAGLPTAVLQRRHAVYIESVSRFNGPSLSGKILYRIPKIEMYTQHPEWAYGKWKQGFSVLDSFRPEPAASVKSNRRLRVFVTLGTIRPYRFDSLIDRLLRICPDAEFVWQLGVSQRGDLPGESTESTSAAQFQKNIDWADVVVSHSGVGSALQILESGKCPVLVPRRAARGEHVDDHQEQIASHLSSKGLAVTQESPFLDLEHLHQASATRIRVK